MSITPPQTPINSLVPFVPEPNRPIKVSSQELVALLHGDTLHTVTSQLPTPLTIVRLVCCSHEADPKAWLVYFGPIRSAADNLIQHSRRADATHDLAQRMALREAIINPHCGDGFADTLIRNIEVLKLTKDIFLIQPDSRRHIYLQQLVTIFPYNIGTTGTTDAIISDIASNAILDIHSKHLAHRHELVMQNRHVHSMLYHMFGASIFVDPLWGTSIMCSVDISAIMRELQYILSSTKVPSIQALLHDGNTPARQELLSIVSQCCDPDVAAYVCDAYASYSPALVACAQL